MSISINRCLVQITPTEKFFKWGNCHEKSHSDYVEPTDSWGNAYLIKELESGGREEVRKRLSKYWKRIAEEEFEGWWNDPGMWPELKTIRDFEKYFTWKHVEIIFDLEEAGIIREEF